MAIAPAACLPQHGGDLASMPVGSWAERNAAPVVRCRECGGLDDVDAIRYSVNAAGVVSPQFRCQTATCRWVAWIVLEGWST